MAAVLGQPSAEIGSLHNALVRLGLCYRTRDGVIDFTVPMFDEFIRRALT